jgi:hypothetical protein
MSSKVWRISVLAVVFAVLGGCSFGLLPSKKRSTDVEVVVAFTGNTNGELVPCG